MTDSRYEYADVQDIPKEELVYAIAEALEYFDLHRLMDIEEKMKNHSVSFDEARNLLKLVAAAKAAILKD